MNKLNILSRKKILYFSLNLMKYYLFWAILKKNQIRFEAK